MAFMKGNVFPNGRLVLMLANEKGTLPFVFIFCLSRTAL